MVLICKKIDYPYRVNPYFIYFSHKWLLATACFGIVYIVVVMKSWSLLVIVAEFY